MAIVSVRQAGLGGFTKNRRLSYTFPSTMGMVLLSPTSIAFSGTSASIGANGQVTFTAVTSLSLNGVFSATYDNYVISMRFSTSGSPMINYRLRVGGTDNSTASSYVRQSLFADGSSPPGAARTTSDLGTIGPSYATQRSGWSLSVYGPFLAQPTATRSLTVSDYLSAYIEDSATTHNQSTSYDGMTFIPSTGSMTGAVQVYGLRS